MLRTSFGRIRPGHPTTSYPGVAQLVARLLWEDRRSIHSPKSESPEVLGLTVIRNEITYQLLADGFRVHTKLPSDS